MPGLRSLDAYFLELAKIVAAKKTSSRVRFMLQDLQDLRNRNWVPRRDVAGPKTIDQIHAEVQEQEAYFFGQQ